LNVGVLPVQISPDFLKIIFKTVKKNPKTELIVNLPNQKISISSSGRSESFDINSYKKENMLNGYDDIDYLNNIKDDISNFAANTPL
jgi:3-isopropylmalate/(R)-2-methylmalate dehydratase small subunit